MFLLLWEHDLNRNLLIACGIMWYNVSLEHTLFKGGQMGSAVAGILTVDKGITGFIIIVVGKRKFELFAAEIYDIIESFITGFGFEQIGKTFG